MDLKNKGLTMEIIADALERCRKARLEILDKVMLPCISEPRADVSEYAPKMISMKIPVEKIREVIGSGGKTIQKICADTGAKVDIDDDGNVFIAAVDPAAGYAAKKMIDDICFVPEVGALYYGKVVRILPIGAFVGDRSGPRRHGPHLQARKPPRREGRGCAERRRHDLGQVHGLRREGPARTSAARMP